MSEDRSPVAPEVDPLSRLVAFDGPPQEFWKVYLSYIAGLVEARACLIAVCPPGGSWSQLFAWPDSGPEAATGQREAFRRAAAELADEVVRAGVAAREMKVQGYRASGMIIGALIPVGVNDATAALFARIDEKPGLAEQKSLLAILRQAAALPSTYVARGFEIRARREAASFGQTLDVLSMLYEEKRFMAAAMLMCNELSSRFECDRVSLGWVKGDYIRLKTVSHAENFEKRMESVRRIETAMEEAFDQDEEIVWPAHKDSTAISREHEALAREQGVLHIASVPLRSKGEPTGVLLFERSKAGFSEGELAHMRLVADQTAPRMAELHDRDRWFGARWWSAARRGIVKLAGPRHAVAKIASILGAVALAIFLFLPVPFRIQAPFVVRAETSVYLPAPFDGYLASVYAEPGDVAEPGQILLQMDTREILLEEAAAIADKQRFLRESDKSRAEGRPAEMRIAAAQAEQARARLGLTRHRLSQASLAAPFEGVVLEGDLRERIGAPLRQGDTLMRLARLDDLYISIDIDQRDIHEVEPHARVRIAFASRPGLWFEGSLERIDPLAVSRERKTFFPAKCLIDGAQPDWMRPGMTGLCKIDAGRRPMAWIATRRTLDFLRLNLWW